MKILLFIVGFIVIGLGLLAALAGERTTGIGLLIGVVMVCAASIIDAIEASHRAPRAPAAPTKPKDLALEMLKH